MLNPPSSLSSFTDLDLMVFNAIVPANHYLRLVSDQIDFERFRPRLAECYRSGMGRPPIDPVRMLKILYLRYHYKLTSDRQVLQRTQTDLAFRWFLGLRMGDAIPHHTDCTNFRKRIGVDKFGQIFQDLVGIAREYGLIHDRLRLKDATHMFAAVANVRPLALVAQVRERLLQTAKPFFAAWVLEQNTAIATMRQSTAELADEERLCQRLQFLQEMAAQLQIRVAALPAPTSATTNARQALDRALAVVAKLCADHQPDEAGDRLVSGNDADARWGWHHDYFIGYLLDMAIDADSEIITAVNVLPGNGAEAADAVTLIDQEETAQGNDVQGISLDGIGYNGPVLRVLGAAGGLNLDVTVPPPPPQTRKTFGPERFALTVINDQVNEVTCPGGQKTRYRQRNDKDTAFAYIFKPHQCADCPLRTECLENPKSANGRRVNKNDYEAEYQKIQEKAQTPAYQETRRQHPKIERKLGEMARHHGARRAHYRGRAKVKVQAFLTAMVVNVKRMLVLLRQAASATLGTLPVRAAMVTR